MNFLKGKSLTIMFVMLGMVTPAFSQAVTTGVITGRAQDGSSAMIPGVEVEVASPAMIGGARMAITNEQGVYRFTQLPAPGIYSVTFTLPGFRTLTVEDINVPAGRTMTINATLEVASVAESVTVTSQAPMIDLEQATTKVNWSQKLLDDLPYGRSVRALGRLIPGMQSTQFDIGGNTAGGSAGFGTSLYGRGGGDNISYEGMNWGSTFGDYGTYSEIQFETAAKGAEAYSPGVNANFIIKSGGNELHGNIMAAIQDDSFQSDNINQRLLDRGLRPSDNKFTKYHDINGDIGGPLMRDRFWFYYAHGNMRSGTFVPGFIRESTGEPQEYYTRLDFTTLKLTYQLTNNQKLEATGQLSRKYTPYREASTLVPAEATQIQLSWSGIGPSLKWTYILNPTMTLDASIQRGGFWWPSQSHTNDIRIEDLTTGQERGHWGYRYSRPIRWQWPVNFSWFSSLGGRNNELKLGYMSWWDKSFTETGGYPNQQIYRYRSTDAEAEAGNYFSTPNSVEIYDYPLQTSSGESYDSFFVNDKLTWNRHLTMNMGVRFERYTSWLPEQGNPGTGPFATKNLFPARGADEFPVYNSIVPRLSLIYDIMGDGRLAFKASYGRYASPNRDAGRVNPAERTRWRYTWDGTIPFNPDRGPDGIFGNGDDPQLLSVDGGGGIDSVRELDPNLDNEIMDEFTAGIEMGFGRDYVLRFNLVRKHDFGGFKTVNRALPFDAYTDVVHRTDPGRDNIVGTADDGTIEVWSVPRSHPGFGQIDEIFQNYDDNEGKEMYTAYDIAFNKAFSNGWSLNVSHVSSFAKERSADPQNPNDLIYSFAQQFPEWQHVLKLNGVYQFPFGLNYSSTYSAQTGQYYGRQVQVRNALGSNVRVPVESQAGRHEPVRMWDNRVSKVFQVNDRHSIEAMFDLYNTLNSAAVLRVETRNGPNYLKPLATSAIDAAAASPILAPRIFRLGMRWRF